MTIAQANKIFQTRYPTGGFCKAGSRYNVAFERGGKLYSYAAESIPALLVRLGFHAMTPATAIIG